jgi:integrase
LPRLDKSFCDKARPKEGGAEAIYFDPDYKGLTLRVGKNYKRWEFRQTTPGDTSRKIRRIKIGPYPLVSPTQAHQRAREYGDPAALPRDETGMTFADAWKLYEARLLHEGKSDKTLDAYRIAFKRVAEIHNMTLRHLSGHPDIVARIHAELTTKGWGKTRRGVPSAADFTASFVGAVYENAKRHTRNLPAELPTTAVNWNRGSPKHKPHRPSLAHKDLAAWERDRLTIKNPVRRELALFVLLSGLRSEDCRSMRWDEIDGNVLHRPKPKGGEGRAFFIPLSGPMVECLERAREAGRYVHEVNGREWVWPADTEAGYVGKLSPADRITPHALRRTYATCALEAGVPWSDVQLLLNHKLPGVTGLYVRGEKMMESLAVAQAKVSTHLIKGLGML